MSEGAQKIPPFPLASYRYPRDRLRHWAALQGDRVFSPTEILVGAGLLGAQSAIKDMVRAQELVRLGRGKLKVGKLHSIVDEDSVHEQDQLESRRRDDAWEALEREIDATMSHRTRLGDIWGLVRESWRDLWPRIESYWSFSLLDAPWVAKTVFTDVPMRKRSDEGDGFAYDFWPRTHMEWRRKKLSRYGRYGVDWEPSRGMRQTATMLGSAQSGEDVAAIWLAAFAFDNGGGRQRLDEHWRGRPRLLVQAIGHIARCYFDTRDYLYDWHHAMTHARPESALRHVYEGSVVPKTLHDCVGIAALDAIVSHSLFVPVRIVPTALPEGDDA